MNLPILIVLGLGAGVLSGMFGIGGGIVIVPALVMFLDFPEKRAIATSLAALIPPVGLLGFFNYYRAGQVDLKAAAIIAAGLFLGAFFGSKITLGLDPATVKRVYGLFLLAMSAKLLLGK